MLFGLDPLDGVALESVGMPELRRSLDTPCELRPSTGGLREAEGLGMSKAIYGRRRAFAASLTRTAVASSIAPAPCPAGAAFRPPASSGPRQHAPAPWPEIQSLPSWRSADARPFSSFAISFVKRSRSATTSMVRSITDETATSNCGPLECLMRAPGEICVNQNLHLAHTALGARQLDVLVDGANLTDPRHANLDWTTVFSSNANFFAQARTSTISSASSPSAPDAADPRAEISLACG